MHAAGRPARGFIPTLLLLLLLVRLLLTLLLTLPDDVTSATHIRNGLSVALGAAWKESMASRSVGPSYQEDSAPPSALLETFSPDRPEAGTNRTYSTAEAAVSEGNGRDAI